MNSHSQYRVFLSYSHKDAELFGSSAIDKIKRDIEADLRTYAGDALVFLDTKALALGDEWHVKITHIINQCNVFICLLSPNYLKSPYCTRERLLWAQKEMALGRFHKETLPIYYIELTNDLFSGEQPPKVQELRALQMNAVPWISGKGGAVPEDIIAERLIPLKEAVRNRLTRSWKAQESFTSVIPGISPFFVGRLKELKELREICFERGGSLRKFPVISADGGVGKTELAIAYAYAYAEDYPQGRFLIRMEGQRDWQSIVISMLNEYGLDGTLVKDHLGISADKIKEAATHPEELHRTIIMHLIRLAKQGALLLLLDNVEDLSLFKRNIMERQFFLNLPIPDNIQIIATSRNSGKVNATDRVCLYELPNLNEDEAFELFCQIGGDDFPFNKRVPDENDPEYRAALEIIKLLDGHAWSLEIIGGQIANGYVNGETGFVSKLHQLRKKFEIASDLGVGHHRAQTQEELAEPSLKAIAALDMGKAILEVATVGTFFQPDQIDQGALEEFCKRNYSASAGYGENFFAVAKEQLERYHLIRCEKTLAKIHRITAAVLQKRTGENELFRLMRKLADLLPTYSQFLFDHFSFVRGMNVSHAAVDLCEKLIQRKMGSCEELIGNRIMYGKMLFRSYKFSDARTVFEDVLASLEKPDLRSLFDIRLPRAGALYWLARLDFECGRSSDAAHFASESHAISAELAEADPQKFVPCLIQSLNLLGEIKKAESFAGAKSFFNTAKEFCELYDEHYGGLPDSIRIETALNIFELAKDEKDLDKYIREIGGEITKLICSYGEKCKKDFDAFAPTFTKLVEIEAQFQLMLRDYGQADYYFSQSINFRNILVKREPDANTPFLARSHLFRCYANILRGEQISEVYLSSAAANAEKALKLYSVLAADNPDAFNEWYATALFLSGKVLLEKRDFSKALEILTQAERIFISLHSSHFCIYHHLCEDSIAAVLKEMGDFQSAGAYYEKASSAISQLPEEVRSDYLFEIIQLHFNWGELCEAMGQDVLAASNYKEGIKLCSAVKRNNTVLLHFAFLISKNASKLSGFFDRADISDEERARIKTNLEETITNFQKQVADAKLLSCMLSPVNISRGVIALLEPVFPEINALIRQYDPKQEIEVYDSLLETIPKPQYISLEVEPTCIQFLSKIRLILTFKQNSPVPDLLIRRCAEILHDRLKSFDNIPWQIPGECLSLPNGEKLPSYGIGQSDKNIDFFGLQDQKLKVAEIRLINCTFTH